MTTSRYYPTDLLLVVEHVERTLADRPESELARLLTDSGLTELWHTEELAEGLDELFGGLSQYPWQPLTDTDDVIEFTPVGTVVLDDRLPGHTLRGLLLAWATGNEVVIRTPRQDLWRALTGLLRDAGFPLPPSRVITDGEPVPGGHQVTVPGLPVAVNLPGEAVATAVRVDCRSAWAGQLQQRTYLRGTKLSTARGADAAQADGRIAAKLRYLIERARRTPYYRDLPRISDCAGLRELPVLDKQALERHSLPFGRELSSTARPSGEVLRSGATSGQPRYIVYSRTDWDNMVREAIPVFYELGLRPGDRILNTLFGGSLYGGLVTSQNELSRMPVETYSAGQAVTVDDLLMLVRSFSANAILGMPTLLLPLLRDAKAREPGLRIEKVLYGGSPMMEADKTWLREHLGAQVVSSVLAANDGAQLGYQCADLGGTLHHICDDYNLLEVVDEHGLPLPDGEAGDLLVTSLQKFEGPLIRYRIGDVGRIFEHKCGCGVTGRVLEYLGRSDGLIKARSETMLYSDLLRELELFGVSQLQVEVTSQDRKETVIVRTESPEPLDPGAVRDHLAARFELLGVAQDFETSDDFFGFEVECLAQGELPRNPVSGKVRTVIDRRVSRPGSPPRRTETS